MTTAGRWGIYVATAIVGGVGLGLSSHMGANAITFPAVGALGGALAPIIRRAPKPASFLNVWRHPAPLVAVTFGFCVAWGAVGSGVSPMLGLVLASAISGGGTGAAMHGGRASDGGAPAKSLPDAPESGSVSDR